MIYLDHAATTPVNPEALKAAWPWLTTEYGNASSHHELGYRASAALEDARMRVARKLNCRTSEVTFTSGGTESDNLGIIGLALANPRGKHIVTAPTEHNAVLQAVDYLQRLHGFDVTYLPVDEQGNVAAEHLRSALRPDTTLVTLMAANNEVGTLHDLETLIPIAHESGALFYTDAVQLADWLPIDVVALGVDALSISGHKFGAPKGSGALFVRGRLALEPMIHGGGQEFGRRSGSENVAWAVALATALEQTDVSIEEQERVAMLRDEFISSVLSIDPRISLTGNPQERLANIASFVVEGVSGESMLLALEERGVICSSGSACAAGDDKPSHVLTAMGYEPDLALTAIRFSLGHETTAEDLQVACAALQDFLR
jgi:cysteine desulfurase